MNRFIVKRYTLFLACTMLSACSVQHARFQSEVLESGFQHQHIKNIAVKVTSDKSELLSGLNEQFLEYLAKNGVEVNAQSRNHLRLHCGEVKYLEDRNLFVVGTARIFDDPKSDINVHEHVNWKLPGTYLACNGLYSNDKPLWRFSFAIHSDYVHDLPNEAISSLSKMMWYQGRGLVDLNTGEIYSSHKARQKLQGVN